MDDQNFKKVGDIKKREDQISSGEVFFLSCQSKLMSHFATVILVSPDTTFKGKCLGKS